jgi:hypothetical protein
MKAPIRLVVYQALLVFGLKALPVGAAAEEFKYYVWIDQQGIVHAEEEPPKGIDYQVRIIEDINANVVPAKDFRVYGDLPAGYGEEADDGGPPPEAGASDD